MSIDNQLIAAIGGLDSEINAMRQRRIMRDSYGLNFAEQTTALQLIKSIGLSIEVAVNKVIQERTK